MFQNISQEDRQKDFEDVEFNNKNKKIERVKELFSVQNIILYAISFMVSMVSFNGEIAPFGLAIFAAVCSNKIAAGVVYVACLLGSLIGFGGNGFLMYLLTTLVFVVMILIFRPNYEDDSRNEKQKLGIYIFAGTLIVQVIKLFFGTFLVYDLLIGVMIAVTTYIFYKIFANSLIVIKEYGKKQAFSIEEVIGASLLISIALASIADLKPFGLSVTNILSVMLVLFLGWENGMLCRCNFWYYNRNSFRNNNRFQSNINCFFCNFSEC